MATPLRCPICHDNQTRFTFIYKFAQDVILDEETGDAVFEADELEAPLRADGTPDVNVKCAECGYTGPDRAFTRRSRHVAKEGKAQRRASG